PRVEKLLEERGLARSAAKPRIVHSKAGLHCRGFHIRQCGKQGTLLTVPQQEKVLKHGRAIRSYLDAPKQTPAGRVRKALNPVIRGWAHDYRHGAAQHVFQKVRHAQWQMLGRWAKRRHPNKGSTWVQARYFRNDSYWTFYEGKADLVKPDVTPITRFTTVTGKNSPDDPTLRQYWVERKKQHVGRETYEQQRRILPQRQGDRCALCSIPFIAGETRETDPMIPPSQGGADDLSNTRLVHPWCHRQRHQKDGRQWPRA